MLGRDKLRKWTPKIVYKLAWILFKRGPSPNRVKSNLWLRKACGSIEGKVLSIGTYLDRDGQGDHYRNYFTAAKSYTTSEVSSDFNCDLVIDVRSMPEIGDSTYDCIFCIGVLEHVDDFMAGVNEITRILRSSGILILGLPFRQSIHMQPLDFWRFTEYGIKFMLKDEYQIVHLEGVNPVKGEDFPATYMVKARKIERSQFSGQ